MPLAPSTHRTGDVAFWEKLDPGQNHYHSISSVHIFGQPENKEVYRKNITTTNRTQWMEEDQDYLIY